MKSTLKPAEQPAAPSPGRRFSSVLDLVKATAADDHVRSFERYLDETQIVKALISARAEAGITQAEVACRMACTQSAVSKLEHSTDGDLTLRDIVKYLNATGGRFTIALGKQPSLVERIKESAICLKQDLDELAELSVRTDDTKLRNGISNFFGEAWYNLFMILCDSTGKLPADDRAAESPVKLVRSDSPNRLSHESPESVPH